MGRVYGIEPGPGVRPAHGCRVFTPAGVKVPFVTRVAFDGDADEGVATVTALARGADGQPIIDPVAGEACRVTFRTWVRLARKGQPDPPPTPDAVLYRQGDGTLKWFETDPIPDAAVAALAAQDD